MKEKLQAIIGDDSSLNKLSLTEFLTIEQTATLKKEMKDYTVYKHGVAIDNDESWKKAAQALNQSRYLGRVEEKKKKSEHGV